MTRWAGAWPSQWPGDWQGGQEASPFANLSARIVGQGSLAGTLEVVGGAGVFADMQAVAQGTAAFSGALVSDQRGFAECACVVFGRGELLGSLKTGEAPRMESAGGSSRRRRPVVPVWPIPALDQAAIRRRRRQEAEAIALEAL